LTDEAPIVEIQLAPEFQRKLKALAKKYRQIKIDLQPMLEQLQTGALLGDQIPGIGSTAMKVRLKNSDSQKGIYAFDRTPATASTATQTVTST
jgi:mRNA-degrading endonuclease RelE of RelBE toxin-antitoxin system